MNRPLEKKIEQLRIENSEAVAERMRPALDSAWNRYTQTKQIPASPPVWRTLMKSRIAFSAVAAIILLIAALPALIPSGVSKPAWAEIVKPIFQAKNAELTIVIGQSDSGPQIYDQVMGSRIRRRTADVGTATLIDMETSRIMALEPGAKTATLIKMENLPNIPNYLEHLRNLITRIEDSNDMDVEFLGEQMIAADRRTLCMKVRYDGGEVWIWVDPQTYAPVQIEQIEGQLRILCKDIRFDVELDESLFSMEVPEGYTLQQTQLDLTSGTEENFIEGLRLWKDYIGEGCFPEDVRVESYIQSTPQIGGQLNAAGIPQEKQMEIGMALGRYLLFIRFYKGDGPWTYAGRGVPYGDPNTPIFWYKPKGSPTHRVIYADLHVEDVTPENLPPAPEPYAAVPAYSISRAAGGCLADSEVAAWHIQPSGRVEVHSEITLTALEESQSAVIDLHYPQAGSPVP